MLGWIGVCSHCRRILNCQSIQTCFITQYEISLWEMQAVDILPRQFSDMLCIAGQTKSLPIAQPCVKMEPQNRKMKLLFLWLVFYVTILLPGEHHLSHKLFTVCSVGYNTATADTDLFWIQHLTFDKTVEMYKFVLKLWHNPKPHNVEITV